MQTCGREEEFRRHKDYSQRTIVHTGAWTSNRWQRHVELISPILTLLISNILNVCTCLKSL